jgi:hypothetical protein
VCPHCQADAKFVNRREKWCTTLLGTIRLTRCYYHCRHCRHGQTPWDRELGVGDASLSPAASEVASLAAVQSSFAQSAETTLRKMCGLKLSESTVERVAEAAGARWAKLLAAKQTVGGAQDWKWQRDAQGRSCAYVSLDATGVRQQGVGGVRAEGRMAYVAMLYNHDSPHDERRTEPHQVRYLAGFYELDDLGLELRRQAAQVGWDAAEQQLALSDGGSGLEEFFRKNFPRAVRILDFWHAKEHLVELGQALWPEAEAERTAWVTAQCHRLKASGGAAVLAELKSLEVSHRSAAVQECHRAHVQYYENHVSRMDYPRYVANGWQIGSGPVESACKTVVGNRLKGGGMRWGRDGSDALCHLRALHLSQSGQWEAFWRDHPN